MRTRWRRCRCLAAAAAIPAGAAQAHSIGSSYVLPLPASLYVGGALGILAITFFLSIAFVLVPPQQHRVGPGRGHVLAPAVVRGLRLLGLGGLLLTLATGFIGANSLYTNLSMTLFYVVFLIGCTYLTALTGDGFAVVSPWRTLLEWAESARPGVLAGRLRHPERWGYVPGLMLFGVFTWIELFVRTRPHSLAWGLLGYTGICLVGAWAWGLRPWLQYGEFLGIYFRVVGKAAPIDWTAKPDAPVHVRFRVPLSGLVEAAPERSSLVGFVAFMVSSMIYHGARETLPWVRLFWQDLHGLVLPWAGDDPIAVRVFFERLQLAYETTALIVSPVALLTLYLGALMGYRWLSGVAMDLKDLARHFAFSLVPIALAYHACHYFTLLVTQGTQAIRLASDPFGFAWNLFGTAHLLQDPLLLEPAVVWHAQVLLMILGHVASILVAHWQSLRLQASRRHQAIGQLPLLVLTMALTTNGLFLLSEPLSSGHGRVQAAASP